MTATNMCSNFGGKWDSLPLLLVVELMNASASRTVINASARRTIMNASASSTMLLVVEL